MNHLLFHLFAKVVPRVDGGSDIFIFGVGLDPLVHGRDLGLLLGSHPPGVHGYAGCGCGGTIRDITLIAVDTNPSVA